MRDVRGLLDELPGNDNLKKLVDDFESKMNNVEQEKMGLCFVPFNDRGEDVHSWLRRFNACAEFKSYNPDKSLKAFCMLMQGSAATWYDSIKDECKEQSANDSKVELQITIQKFTERFKKGNSWIEEHVMQFVTQKQSQTVAEFYSLITEKMHQIE